MELVRRGCTDDNGVRLLYRLPTDSERSALTGRRLSLESSATPALPAECAMAVAQMLSGFPSYRAGQEEAEIMATQYVVVLREFPAWAIREACQIISSGRLVGDEVLNLNPTFPPSAEQVCIVARRQVRSLDRELTEVREVLAGRVEDLRPRPTRAEIEAKLNRPIGHPPSGRLASIPPEPPMSNERRERMLADLAARKARNEASRGDGGGAQA